MIQGIHVINKTLFIRSSEFKKIQQQKNNQLGSQIFSYANNSSNNHKKKIIKNKPQNKTQKS